MRSTRHLVVAVAFVAPACSVEDKNPTSDAAVDAATGGDGADDVAPETTITVAPPAFSNLAAAEFHFVSDDPTAAFECSIDGEAAVPCTSPYVRTLGDGPHGIVVRAVDPAGNGDDSPAEHQWSIDRVAPETTLTERPPVTDNSVVVRFSFESDEDNVTFDCAIDGGGFAPCQSGGDVGPLGDGTHSFAVRAIDRAGNIDASPAIHAWTIDTSMPDTTLVSGPQGATSSTAATFTFVSPDAGAGATFQCQLDGSGFTGCTSPRMHNNLGEGQHTFAVRVRDAVGNLDPTPATRTWRVDLTPPNTTITSGPSGAVAAASATFVFSSNESGATFACSLDGAPFAACTSPHAIGGLAQGDHAFSVHAVDAAGHVDASPAMRSWTVDTIAPDVTFTVAPPATSGPRVAFEFTASDGDVTCSLDAGAFATCASPQAFNAPDGPHVFRVRAVDDAGNATTAPRSWTVACLAPDTLGAAGLLHFDVADQSQPDAVGGAAATLGADATVEVGDPAALAAARFGGGLAFTALDGDHVAWPIGLATMDALTVELWSQPGAPAGSRDVIATADAGFRIRVATASPSTVRFVAEGGTPTAVTMSAPVAAGAWHHVIASIDGAMLRLWVDGVRTDTAVQTSAAAVDAIAIGGAYDGALDEIWLSQTAITADEDALVRYCPP
jgi:hypothetical protein